MLLASPARAIAEAGEFDEVRALVKQSTEGVREAQTQLAAVMGIQLEYCEDPEFCAVPVKRGEPALFDGQLVTDPLLAELVAAQENYEESFIEYKRHSDEKLRVTVDGLNKLHAAELSGKDREIALLRAAASANEWWESPWFWFPVGLVAGGTAVLLFNTSNSQ